MAGTLIILITSLFMNAGATRIVEGSRSMERIVMNSIIASGTGGLYVVLMQKMRSEWQAMYANATTSMEDLQTVDTQMICGGVLAGLVSVTSICHTISLGGACLVGFIGSFLYTQLQKTFDQREIDDPLHSSSIHGICGGWSLIAAGLFDPETGLLYVGNPNQLVV